MTPSPRPNATDLPPPLSAGRWRRPPGPAAMGALRLRSWVGLVAGLGWALTVSAASLEWAETPPEGSAREPLELAVGVTDLDAPNPFTETTLTATFTPSEGESWTVPGFCDSEDGALFRVRFTPPAPGRWAVRLELTDRSDAAALEGAVEVGAGTGRGFVRAQGGKFVTEDGRALLPCSQTAWLLAGCTEAQILAFLDRTAARRQNVVRMGLECNYYDDDVGLDCWPWRGSRGSPDYTRFALTYWRRVDELVRQAQARGIHVELTLFTGLKTNLSWEHTERYLGYAVARLAAFPGLILWQTCNEHNGGFETQKRMGEWLHAHDPYRHLVAPSFGTTADAAWPNEPWVDVAINHSCTDDSKLKDRYYYLAKNITRYGKPGWSDEMGREVRHGNDDPVHRRKQLWTLNIAGAHWNYHSREGCEEIRNTTYLGPGQQYLAHILPFWERTDWPHLARSDTAIEAAPDSQYAWALAGPAEVVAYLVNEASGAETEEGHLRLRLPRAGRYRADFYQPADGSNHPWSGTFHTVGPDLRLTLDHPAFTDDLVLHLVHQEESLHADATDAGQGWWHSPWLGYFAPLGPVEGPAWHYTPGHGFWYVQGVGRTAFAYDAALGRWLYLTAEGYPFLYLFPPGPAGWYWYEPGTLTPARRFQQPTADGWQARPETELRAAP